MFKKKPIIATPWRQRLRVLRFRRQDQSVIRMHRAMYQLRLGRSELLVAIMLPMIFNLLLFLLIDELIWFWRAILDFWVPRLDFGASVAMRTFDFGFYDLWVPSVVVDEKLPSAQTWWITSIVCAMTFFLTYAIKPNKGLPAIYILRALILIQTTAQLYFAFIPASFPLVLEEYVGNNLFIGVLLIALIPWMLGVTYYVFDFALLQKVSLTLLIIGFLVVAVPLQYLLHANLLAKGSLLFAPLLYLVFGLFLDVMAFIALYSFGMSWRFKKTA